MSTLKVNNIDAYSNNGQSAITFKSSLIVGDDTGSQYPAEVYTGSLESRFSSAAMGESCKAKGKSSFAQGKFSNATGDRDFAHGYAAMAASTPGALNIGAAHAEGFATIATGEFSHAEGTGTQTTGS